MTTVRLSNYQKNVLEEAKNELIGQGVAKVFMNT